MPHTFSFYGSVLGAAGALHPRTRRASGWLLLVVGLGGFGVAWERLTGCDLRRLRTAKFSGPLCGVAQHAPQALVGAWLVRGLPPQR